MKKLVTLVLALLATAAWSQVYVAPHVRPNGTVVQGHFRSAPDSTPLNNYGSQGNVNPYTGQRGTANPYPQPQPYGGSIYQPQQPSGMYQPQRPRY